MHLTGGQEATGRGKGREEEFHKSGGEEEPVNNRSIS